MQQDALDELKMFSQAKLRGGRGAPLSGLPGYAYDSRGGQGITVYVIDTGINKDHAVSVADYQYYSLRLTHLQEFRSMQGNKRWLYLPGEPHIESDEIGHGTCVASKVAGPTFGVAKSANIVVVKMQPVAVDLHMSHVTAAWGIVAGDIASMGLRGRAVVLATLSSE